MLWYCWNSTMNFSKVQSHQDPGLFFKDTWGVLFIWFPWKDFFFFLSCTTKAELLSFSSFVFLSILLLWCRSLNQIAWRYRRLDFSELLINNCTTSFKQNVIQMIWDGNNIITHPVGSVYSLAVVHVYCSRIGFDRSQGSLMKMSQPFTEVYHLYMTHQHKHLDGEDRK